MDMWGGYCCCMCGGCPGIGIPIGGPPPEFTLWLGLGLGWIGLSTQTTTTKDNRSTNHDRYTKYSSIVDKSYLGIALAWETACVVVDTSFLLLLVVA